MIVINIIEISSDYTLHSVGHLQSECVELKWPEHFKRVPPT